MPLEPQTGGQIDKVEFRLSLAPGAHDAGEVGSVASLLIQRLSREGNPVDHFRGAAAVSMCQA